LTGSLAFVLTPYSIHIFLLGTVALITAVQFCLNGLLQQCIRAINSASSDIDVVHPLTNAETISAALGAGALSALFYSPV